jgi:hypothetical protein
MALPHFRLTSTNLVENSTNLVVSSPCERPMACEAFFARLRCADERGRWWRRLSCIVIGITGQQLEKVEAKKVGDGEAELLCDYGHLPHGRPSGPSLTGDYLP